MNMLDKDMERHLHNPQMDLSPKRKPYWKGAHRDWKFWLVALFLLALMIFYTMSDNFALRGRGPRTLQTQPIQPIQQPMPAVPAP
jgi:hypothetical protein